MFFFSNHPDSHAIIVEHSGRWQDVDVSPFAVRDFFTHVTRMVLRSQHGAVPQPQKALTSSAARTSVADGAYGIYVSVAAASSVVTGLTEPGCGL